MRDSRPRSWYDLRIWRGRGGLRDQALKRDGYRCRQEGCGRLCTRKGEAHVDHIKPHRHRDWVLFVDLANLQTLCAACHAKHKQREEANAGQTRFGEDGWPIIEQ